MYNFGERSNSILETCEDDLQRLFREVVQRYDCTVLPDGGHRSPEKQAELFASGASRVQHSKHNAYPSQAVDVSPYPIPEDWGETNPYVKAQFYHFAGYVLRVAHEMGIEVRWGGDWDSDLEFHDQKFNDLVHWELV